MQSKRTNDSRKSVLPSARRQAARDAIMRVTQELIQSHAPSRQENLPANEHAVESAPEQNVNQSITEHKTRILKAIQPVLEIVADSAQHHNGPRNVQL
jgi:hypothetical protein